MPFLLFIIALWFWFAYGKNFVKGVHEKSKTDSRVLDFILPTILHGLKAEERVAYRDNVGELCKQLNKTTVDLRNLPMTDNESIDKVTKLIRVAATDAPKHYNVVVGTKDLKQFLQTSI